MGAVPTWRVFYEQQKLSGVPQKSLKWWNNFIEHAKIYGKYIDLSKHVVSTWKGSRDIWSLTDISITSYIQVIHSLISFTISISLVFIALFGFRFWYPGKVNPQSSKERLPLHWKSCDCCEYGKLGQKLRQKQSKTAIELDIHR